MPKLLKDTLEECQPYLDGLKKAQEFEENLNRVSQKRAALDKEVSVMKSKLDAFERERQGLLRAVLNGTSSEPVLDAHHASVEKLKSELASKDELLALATLDIEKHSRGRSDLNANIGVLRRQTMAAIESQLLGEISGDLIGTLLNLSAVAGANGRTLPMLLNDLLGEHPSAWWESRRVEVLVGYGLPA